MTTEKQVSIIITNYNGEQFLGKCLDSVLKTNFPSFEIIVIDDGSQDKSLEIANHFNRTSTIINIIKNNHQGAAASRNKAAQTAIGEFLIFLDNDTEVEPNWIEELVNVVKNNSHIAAAQALLKDYQSRDKIQNAGVKLWAATGWGLPQAYDHTQQEPIPIIAISAALIIRADIFKKVGGFDEREAVVTEDLDLSWRIWLLGYQIVLAPRSIVYHWTKPMEMRKNLKHTYQKIYFHLTKNSLRSIIKNYQVLNIIKYCLQSTFISIGRGLLVLWVRKDSAALIGALKGIIWNIANIQSTLRCRQDIQSTRVLNDNDIISRIFVDDKFLKIYKQYFIQTNLMN